MYGLIEKINAVSGLRDTLTAVFDARHAGSTGCLSYIVAHDPSDPNGIWITEVWESQANHQGSLKLPSVQKAIAAGRPLIAGFGERYETIPVGGIGLVR